MTMFANTIKTAPVSQRRGAFNKVFQANNSLFTRQVDVPEYQNCELDFFMATDSTPKFGTKEQLAGAALMLAARREGTWLPFVCFDDVPLISQVFSGRPERGNLEAIAATVTMKSQAAPGLLQDLSMERARYTGKAKASAKHINPLLELLGNALPIFNDSVVAFSYKDLLSASDKDLTSAIAPFWTQLNETLRAAGHSGTAFTLRMVQPVENVHIAKHPSNHTYMVKHHGQPDDAASVTSLLTKLKLGDIVESASEGVAQGF